MAETKEMWPTAKEYMEPSEVGWGKEQIIPGAWEGAGPADTLIVDFQPPQLSLSGFKPPVSGNLLHQPQEMNTSCFPSLAFVSLTVK